MIEHEKVKGTLRKINYHLSRGNTDALTSIIYQEQASSQADSPSPVLIKKEQIHYAILNQNIKKSSNQNRLH